MAMTIEEFGPEADEVDVALFLETVAYLVELGRSQAEAEEEAWNGGDFVPVVERVLGRSYDDCRQAAAAAL